MARNVEYFEGAEIFFRNFSGAPKDFNPAGRRNFCLDIPEDRAEELRAKGWNVKDREPKEEGQLTKHHVQVEIRFNKEMPMYDPEIYLIVGNTKRRLAEDELSMLDQVDIINVDLEVNPHDWGTKRNGAPAIKAYVKRMAITIRPNRFDEKYAYNYQSPEEAPF